MDQQRARAVAYLRISRDSDARGEGVHRQRADTERLAEQSGYDLVQVFEENDVSASTNSQKPRPQYEAMLDMVRRGEVDVVLGYSLSRITRRVREWVDLIDLAKQTGVQFRTCLREDPDLTTASGRERAIAMAARDQYEAEVTSERLKRQKAQRAAEGLPQGGRHRLYGYTRSWEVVPDEARALREVFERRASGQSVTSLARLLEGRGLTTSSGSRWTSGTLARTLANPTYCGLRSHRGEIVGRSTVEAIVDEPLWRRANSDQIKGQSGTNARRWLLSGLLRCSRCGEGMIGNGSRAGYRCNKAWRGCGNTTVQWAGADGAIVSLVLAREAARPHLRRPFEPAPNLDEIDREIETARSLLDSGDLSLTDFAFATKTLRARRAEAEAKAAARATPASTGLIVTLADWTRMDLSERRALVGRHLDHVNVMPAGRGGARLGPVTFDVQRLVIRWVGGSEQQVTEPALASIPRWDPARSVWSIPTDTPIARLGPMRLDHAPAQVAGTMII